MTDHKHDFQPEAKSGIRICTRPNCREVERAKHRHKAPASVPADVARLVIAARLVVFGEQPPHAADIKALDVASEAFADRVAWEGGPESHEAPADPHERNLTASNSELIEQALTHPPLEAPAEGAGEDDKRAWIERWNAIESAAGDALHTMTELLAAPNLKRMQYALGERRDALATALNITEAGTAWMRPRSSVPEAREDYVGQWQDKAEGLEADLMSAVLVAWKRGAYEWCRLNYPGWVEWLEASSPQPERAPEAREGGIREILRKQAADPRRYLNPTHAVSDNVFVDHDPEARFISDDYSDTHPAAPSADKLRIAVDALGKIERGDVEVLDDDLGVMVEVSASADELSEIASEALAALKAEGAK